MSDTAVHLVEEVLPSVPVRHWIVSLPWNLRCWLGYDRGLCAKVTELYAEGLLRWMRHRGKQRLGLSGIELTEAGAVVAVQRVDSALRLNVHLHAMVLDGVYLPKDSLRPGHRCWTTKDSPRVFVLSLLRSSEV